MSTIQDTDLLLVNRGGTDYKVTAKDLNDYLNYKEEEVILVTPPVIDPPYVPYGGVAYGKTAEYKLDYVRADPPVYKYVWCYKHTNGNDIEMGLWDNYNGQPIDLEFGWLSNKVEYFLRCKYTYKGKEEIVESNRAPLKPKPVYIPLKDYLSTKLSNLENAKWAGEVGDWVYCEIRYRSPDQAKGGMFRFKRSTFDYDMNADQLEKVFDWPASNIDGYGGYLIFSEQHIMKNRDYNYFVSVDAGKTWTPSGVRLNINGRDCKAHNVISKLSSNTFRTLVNSSSQTERFKGQADLTFNADSTITITNGSDVTGQWGYFWLYNAMDWKGSVQCVPDSNGYFFGASQDWSTYYRWTDKDWNPTTVPETMSAPSFTDQPANTYVTYSSSALWDEVTQSYVFQVEFKENGTNTLKGGGVYHFKWGDTEYELHPANSAIGAVSRYDYWCKVIVRGEALGWQLYKQNGSFFRYDVGGNYKMLLDCPKPTNIFMGCNLNRYTYISGGDFILNGDDCK